MPHLYTKIFPPSLLNLILGVICLLFPVVTHAHSKSYRFSEHNGKMVRSITVEIDPIFDKKDSAFIYTTANQVKFSTAKTTVRREVTLKEQEPFHAFALDDSLRRLRSLRYLSKVRATVKPSGHEVDVVFHVQDTWTLIPQLNISSGYGKNKVSVGFAESDLFGLGKRLEMAYQKDEANRIIETVYDDNRLFGSDKRLLLGYFDRTDGEQSIVYFGRPFRSLLDENSWYTSEAHQNVVGRLFKDASEDYIFRQKSIDLAAKYSYAMGNPESRIWRLSLGYAYSDYDFSQAKKADYRALSLDPRYVSNSLDRLPQNRRYTGPTAGIHSIVPDYVSMNYIDRFDRVEDYNLGAEIDANVTFAPTLLGSMRSASIFAFNACRGERVGQTGFLRGEMGVGTRLDYNGVSNALSRAELKYYHVFGNLMLGDLFLGKHTFASSLSAEYGYDLDGDRQLLAGGDNALRGYEARTFTGDKRLIFNIEDRVHIADDVFDLVSIGAAAFADMGGATYDNFYSLLGNNLYGDVGVGLRIAFPHSSGSRVLRLDLAFPWRDGPDGSASFQIRMIFAGGQLFSSHLASELSSPEQATASVGFEK